MELVDEIMEHIGDYVTDQFDMSDRRENGKY